MNKIEKTSKVLYTKAGMLDEGMGKEMNRDLDEPLKNIVIVLASVLSTVSICLNVSVLDHYSVNGVVGRVLELIKHGLSGNAVMFACVFAFVLWLFLKASEKKNDSKWLTFCLAFLFSIFMVLGKSYAALNSWNYLFQDSYQLVFASLVLVGYLIFFYAVCQLLFDLVDRGMLHGDREETDEKLLRRRFLLVYLIIFACWLPYLLVFYPGSVPYDGYYQLNMFYGYNPASNHHPWLTTLLIGWITSLGRIINDNFGVFVYVLLQSMFCAFAFAAVSCKIMMYRVAKWIKMAVVLYFAILPAWGAYAQTLMKDVVYYGLFALFGILYVEIVEKQTYLTKKRMTAFFILGCLLVQYRNEGIYIIGASVFLLLFVLRGRRGGMIVALVGVMVFHATFNSMVLPAMGVSGGSKKEMLSVPFQQTARYVSMYEDELSEEEIYTINQVLEYGTIKEKYNPINSDPVKNSYRHPSKQVFLEYVKVWLAQFKKRPACYIQATLNNCFGYFYPGYIQNSISNMQFYIKGEPLATGDLNIYYVGHENARKVLSNYALLWFELPGVSLLLYPGTYTWLLLACLAVLIRKKKWKACIAGSLPMLTVAICLISPVNGYLRYMLPVMAFMPLMVVHTIDSVRN